MSLFKKNINLKNFKYLGYPQKINQTVVLTQMDEEEMKKIKNKQKMKISSDIQKKDKPELKKIPTLSSNKNINEVRPKSIIQNMDDLANNNHESNFEYVTNYKKYFEDNSIFKVPLPESYVLNNKLSFSNEIRDKLTEYLNISDKQISDESSCDDSTKATGFDPLIHQELVKQYLNSYSPYRGLVLYHGLGSGKTCTSIGVIEAMKTTKKKNIYFNTSFIEKKLYFPNEVLWKHIFSGRQ